MTTLDLLPTEILINVLEQVNLDNISWSSHPDTVKTITLSLVCWKWYYLVNQIANRKLWIDPRNIKKFIEASTTFNQENLLAIRDLNIDCLSFFDVAETYTRIRLEIDIFETLISLLPNVTSISISGIEEMDFSNRSLLTTCQSTSTRNLRLEFPGNHNSLDIIAEFISKFPGLEKLDVRLTFFCKNQEANILYPVTTSTFPINSLAVTYWGSAHSQLSSIERNFLSTFPSRVFIGMRRLHLDIVVPVEDFLILARIIGPTLNMLHLSTHKINYSYLEWIKIFNLLSSIQNLSCQKTDFPADLLQHIPASIKVLGVRLSFHHLEFLHFHPRPKLNLENILVVEHQAQLFKYIPVSVRKIEVANRFQPKDMCIIRIHKFLRRSINAEWKLKMIAHSCSILTFRNVDTLSKANKKRWHAMDRINKMGIEFDDSYN